MVKLSGESGESGEIEKWRNFLAKVEKFIYKIFSQSTPIHAGTAAGRALRATIECSRGTTSDEEDVEDEGDMPPSLEGEDNEDKGLSKGTLPVVSLIALPQ